MRRVELPDCVPGALFLSQMPGRDGRFLDTADQWERNAVDVVVCLTDPAEISRRSPEYARAIESDRIEPERLCYPIQDFDVPGNRDAYREFVDDLVRRLRDGQRILVHCYGGIGRTGMTAVAILLGLGVDLDDALGRVDDAGSHPERTLQLELCRWMAKRSTSGNSSSP